VKLENICVSKDLAVELKENGYEQESLFCWVKNEGRNESESRTYILDTDHAYNFKPDRYWCCPTASELVERLPYMVAIKNREYSISYHKIDHRYSCSLICESEQEGYCENICQQERGDSCRYNVFEDKLADALAKMWLYLKKNKLLAGDPNE